MTGQARSASVEAWLDQQTATALYLTSVTIAEMSVTIGTMSDDKRREAFADALDLTVELFAGRILSFDLKAAQTYGVLAKKAAEYGKEIPAPDRYVAAIAASKGYMFATNNPAPFLSIGLMVVEPWNFLN
jgi:predicted nucleic acid-binding protein